MLDFEMAYLCVKGKKMVLPSTGPLAYIENTVPVSVVVALYFALVCPLMWHL